MSSRLPICCAACAPLWFACAPEPLAFEAADSSIADVASDAASDAPSEASDAASEHDAGQDATAVPTVYLLVRPNVFDPTVNQLRSDLESSGIDHAELLPEAMGTVESSRSVFVAGFSTKSDAWAAAAPALMDAVSEGSWILFAGYALQLLEDAGVAAVKENEWAPGCTFSAYFVAPIDAPVSPVLEPLPTWHPPVGSDKSSHHLYGVLAAGASSVGLVPESTFGWDAPIRYWALQTGCSNLPVNSSYCQSWGGCMPERAVAEGQVRTRTVGSGRIAFFVDRVEPGVFAWGPATALLHGSFVKWAIDAIASRG